MKLISEEILNVNFLAEDTEDGKKAHFIEGVSCREESKIVTGDFIPWKL